MKAKDRVKTLTVVLTFAFTIFTYHRGHYQQYQRTLNLNQLPTCPTTVNAATLSRFIKEFEVITSKPPVNPITHNTYPQVRYGHVCTSHSYTGVPYNFPLTGLQTTPFLSSDHRSPTGARI
ncbi:hypothetical protein BKA57DRAFT_440974 [Linnemannia elongata]|nr:hypothetical protein BKA57DRAFT_440974 [Linnemannia elongata]